MSSYGYDSGFAGKYDKDRADECQNEEDDEYNEAGIILAKTEDIPRQNVMVSKTI